VLLDLSVIKQHLLITDLNMSGIDGFELIKKLQAHPQFSGLPILVVTGLSIQEIEDRGGCHRRFIFFKSQSTWVRCVVIVKPSFLCDMASLLSHKQMRSALLN